MPYTARRSAHYAESQRAGNEQRGCRAKQERVKAHEVAEVQITRASDTCVGVGVGVEFIFST
jgi:hypothetical protein